jgi:DNA-binding transcriptional LysR family regulator
VEARLGVAIVERVGRGVRLTEAGRVLARHAPAVTHAFDAAAEELAELRGLRTGVVRLVAFLRHRPCSCRGCSRRLRHPTRSHAHLCRGGAPEAVEAIREDRADIALTFSYPGTATIRTGRARAG